MDVKYSWPRCILCDLERKIPFTSQIRKRTESARKYFISNDDLEIGRFVFFFQVSFFFQESSLYSVTRLARLVPFARFAERKNPPEPEFISRLIIFN